MAFFSNLRLHRPDQGIYKLLAKACVKFLMDLNAKRESPLNLGPVIKFILAEKAFIKYAFMCFLYNQKAESRFRAWLKLFKKKGIFLEVEAYNFLFGFSLSFVNFLDQTFPGLKDSITVLKGINALAITNLGCSKIKTLDGNVLEWRYFKTEEKSGAVFNPVSSAWVPIKHYHLTNSLDPKKLELSFLPNLIHSVDAFIVRRLCLEVFKSCNYILQHTHDSFSFHPNLMKAVNEAISGSYEGSGSWLKAILIDPLKQDLEERGNQEGLMLLESFSKELKTLKPEAFEVKYQYPLE